MVDSSRGKRKGRLSSLAISLASINPTGVLDGHVFGYCTLQAATSRTKVQRLIQKRELDILSFLSIKTRHLISFEPTCYRHESHITRPSHYLGEHNGLAQRRGASGGAIVRQPLRGFKLDGDGCE